MNALSREAALGITPPLGGGMRGVLFKLSPAAVWFRIEEVRDAPVMATRMDVEEVPLHEHRETARRAFL